MIDFDPARSGFGMPAAVCDASGQRLVVADQYADMLQMPKSEMLHRPWQMMVHPDDIPNLAGPYNRLIVCGTPYETSCRILCGDGNWLPVRYEATRTVEGRNGRILIRGHVKLDRATDFPEPAVRPAPDASASAEYIREIARELGELAGAQRMRLLQHLLAMASAEADIEAERRLGYIKAQLPDLLSTVH